MEEPVQSLLKNVMRHRVTFDGRCFRLRVSNPTPRRKVVTCAGVHATIRGMLAPYRIPAPPETARVIGRAQPWRRSRVCYAGSAIEHGALVHGQLERYVREVMKGGTGRDIATRFLKGLRAPPDPCVADALQVIDDKKWTPVATEYAVACEDLEIATQADLVVKHRETGKLILVELKTTRSREEHGGFDTSDGTCWNPPNAPKPLALSELTIHMLQVLITREMLRRWSIEIDAMYVLRVGPGCAPSVYRVPAWLDAYVPAIWEQIAEWRVRTKPGMRRRRAQAAQSGKRRRK